MRRTPLALLAAIAALSLLAACGSVKGPGRHHSPTPPPPLVTGSPAPAPTFTPGNAPVPVSDPGHVTGTLKGEHCTSRGGLPDAACTPGAFDPHLTAAILCAPGYTTRHYRPPVGQTDAFKHQQAYPAYGLPAGAITELDHLIPLELGGANDALNLWPEPGSSPNPKDGVELDLHKWACATTGQAAETRLRQAQLAIAANWATAEKVLGVSH